MRKKWNPLAEKLLIFDIYANSILPTKDEFFDRKKASSDEDVK